MDKKEATDKKIEAMNMYDKLNFENQNTVFMVLKGMLISQENTKKICDVYGGVADLKNKVLKCVETPEFVFKSLDCFLIKKRCFFGWRGGGSSLGLHL